VHLPESEQYALIQKMDMHLGSFISSQITLMAQHNSSRLGVPVLITALCKARGVHSDFLTLESLSPAINLAYIKKNYWNLDDPIVTFRGPRKARGKRSEAPSTTPPAPAPSPAAAEEETTPAQSPQPSPLSAPAPKEIQPSALDLNEDQPQEEQDV